LPKKYGKWIFGDNGTVEAKKKLQSNVQCNFWRLRKRVAKTLENPRISQISLHTFRHFKATMEYARTKDILYVMQLLGHRNIQNTLIYTQLVNFKSAEYHSATAKTAGEAKQLVESGFEFVCTTPENVMLFRKRR